MLPYRAAFALFGAVTTGLVTWLFLPFALGDRALLLVSLACFGGFLVFFGLASLKVADTFEIVVEDPPVRRPDVVVPPTPAEPTAAPEPAAAPTGVSDVEVELGDLAANDEVEVEQAAAT